ncbi:hypothetical protein EVAR_79623_1 [Eumeta japonica]|uniref:Uncharacterized protein n=1 Tax=Eumeta variegata TaxID=151549 RepID=A0A4C1UFP1_EUMVA|nr:hypothetical protein EVAR_79623_1 [Eumeta japonica]
MKRRDAIEFGVFCLEKYSCPKWYPEVGHGHRYHVMKQRMPAECRPSGVAGRIIRLARESGAGAPAARAVPRRAGAGRPSLAILVLGNYDKVSPAVCLRGGAMYS